MPIYEFYCRTCHVVYNFFSARIDTTAKPQCPRCDRPDLERKPSRFATLKQQPDAEGEEAPMAGFDESKIEGAMESLMGEMGSLEEDDDPRAMGRMMRRFGELSGLEMGDRMEEIVGRMEAGEDPESLEKEMGNEMEGEDISDFFKLKQAAARARKRHPRVDDELYFL